MAGTIKGITIELAGKTTKLTEALKEVTKPANDLQANLKKVNSALKLDPSSTDLLAEKQKILASSVDITKDKLEKLESVQEQVKQQYANGDIDQGAYLSFQLELEQTRAKLEGLENQQKQFGSVVQQQMDVAGQKVADLGNKVSDAGNTLTAGVTAPTVALGTAALAAFSTVDEGVDTIAKATGASGDALSGMESVYKKIASEMPADFDVVAAAVGEVNTRFHTTGAELENQTKLMVQFSEITGTDVVQATDDADKALKAYGKSSDDLQGFLGLVAAKSQQTGISAQSLMQDVAKNAASFKELGFSIEESIGLLAQMDENGVDASTALSGLKKAVTNLTESGMAQDEALRTVIDSIKNASSETEALQIAQETFGTKGAAEMATAIREGRFDIDALSESMDACSSVVSDTFASTVGDAADESKIALNALTVAGAELGGSISEMLAPIIMDIAELIRDLTAKWNTLDDGQKNQIITIAAVVAAIGPVLSIGGKLITGVGAMIKVVGSLGSAFSFLAANPVGAVIAAIAGIVAILVTAYNKCEWFRNGVDSAISAVKNILTSAVDAVSNTIKKIQGVFNFEWEWPKLKLPHFSVSGRFSLNPPSIPKIGVEWYAKGGILNGAQIFGTLGGNLLGGGEAGPEAVLPLSGFYDNLRSILTQLLGGVQESRIVALNLRIDHFENSSDRDLDELVDYVEDRLETKLRKREAAIT